MRKVYSFPDSHRPLLMVFDNPSVGQSHRICAQQSVIQNSIFMAAMSAAHLSIYCSPGQFFALSAINADGFTNITKEKMFMGLWVYKFIGVELSYTFMRRDLKARPTDSGLRSLRILSRRRRPISLVSAGWDLHQASLKVIRSEV